MHQENRASRCCGGGFARTGKRREDEPVSGGESGRRRRKRERGEGGSVGGQARRVQVVARAPDAVVPRREERDAARRGKRHLVREGTVLPLQLVPFGPPGVPERDALAVRVETREADARAGARRWRRGRRKGDGLRAAASGRDPVEQCRAAESDERRTVREPRRQSASAAGSSRCAVHTGRFSASSSRTSVRPKRTRRRPSGSRHARRASTPSRGRRTATSPAGPSSTHTCGLTKRTPIRPGPSTSRLWTGGSPAHWKTSRPETSYATSSATPSSPAARTTGRRAPRPRTRTDWRGERRQREIGHDARAWETEHFAGAAPDPQRRVQRRSPLPDEHERRGTDL